MAECVRIPEVEVTTARARKDIRERIVSGKSTIASTSLVLMVVHVKISARDILALVELASQARGATLPRKVARKTRVKMAPHVSKVKVPTHVSVKQGSQAGTVTRRSTNVILIHAKTVSVLQY